MIKPPYRVPSMSEIITRSTSDAPVVASLFGGGGCSSTGYRMAWCRVVYVNEFVEAAADTCRANYPDKFVDVRDVRTVHGPDIKRIVSGANVDILDGSPPCSALSVAGKREKLWGKIKRHLDTEQRVRCPILRFRWMGH